MRDIERLKEKIKRNSYLEISGGQSSNLNLNVHCFTTNVN